MKAKPFLKFLQWATILICVYFLYDYFTDHKEDIKLLLNIRPLDVLRLFCLSIIAHFIFAYRLFLILGNLGLKTIKFREWLDIFSISRFINFHIAQGALIYRGLQLKNKYGFAYTKTLSLNVYFSWLSTITILPIAIFILPNLDRTLLLNKISAQSIAIGIFIFLILFPFAAQSFLKLEFKLPDSFNWILFQLKNFTEHFTKNIKNLKFLMLMIAFHLVSILVQSVWMYTCFQSLGTHLGWTNILLFTITWQLSTMVRITPGNFGIAEFVSGFLVNILGGSFGTGVLVSALFRIINYFSTIIMTLIFSRSFKLLPKDS